MEADWSAEVGQDLPRIYAPWPGYVDLAGLDAAAVAGLASEAAGRPALAEALSRLNAGSSRLRTTKCDVWTIPGEEIDPYEFDADAVAATCGLGSYIDVLPLDPLIFRSFPLTEVWARSIAQTLSPVPLRHARAEAVVRSALLQGTDGYALTLYTFGCGAETAQAAQSWEQALAAAVAATIATIPHSAGE